MNFYQDISRFMFMWRFKIIYNYQRRWKYIEEYMFIHVTIYLSLLQGCKEATSLYKCIFNTKKKFSKVANAVHFATHLQAHFVAFLLVKKMLQITWKKQQKRNVVKCYKTEKTATYSSSKCCQKPAPTCINVAALYIKMANALCEHTV